MELICNALIIPLHLENADLLELVQKKIL